MMLSGGLNCTGYCVVRRSQFFAAAILLVAFIGVNVFFDHSLVEVPSEPSPAAAEGGDVRSADAHANMGVDISILEQDGVEKDMPDHRGANNFTRFISYGEPRSASTLQFSMVCVCFFLHMTVHKSTLANSTKCYFGDKENYNYPSLDLPQGK